MAKRLVPLAFAALLVAAPAQAWGATNGGISAPAAPIPTAAQGGTAYGSVPLPAHPRKRRRPRRAPAAPTAPGATALLTGVAALAHAPALRRGLHRAPPGGPLTR